MHRLREIIISNKGFFISYLILLFLALIPQLFLSQNELFLEINKLHNSFFDTFFYWLTYFGDGITFSIIILIFLFYSYGKSLTGLVVFLFTSIIAQLLKQVFFNDHYRPYGVLGDTHIIHIPGGVTPLINNSFPSGHTVTAFALATFLVLEYSGKRMLWVFMLVLAWLIGYSRIYLTHHFPIDVWVGSLIGVTGTLLIYTLFASGIDNKLGKKSILKR